MEYTTGVISWRKVLRRAVVGLLPRRSGQRRPGWSAAVPLIALAAGLLFTTSATAANGTSLREDRRPELAQLMKDRRDQVVASEKQAAALRADVERQTESLAGSDAPVAAQRDRAAASRVAAGFTALAGPGLVVELNDAPDSATTAGRRTPATTTSWSTRAMYRRSSTRSGPVARRACPS